MSSILDKNRPAWLKRALDPSTPTTKDKETVRTMSVDGKLFPTIRMIDGKLVRLSADEAYEMAMKKGDYIQLKDDSEATKVSKEISSLIGKARMGKK